MSLDFSVFLPTGFAQEFAAGADPAGAYQQITDVAQAADELGFHTLYVPDHLHPIPSTQGLLFEAWSVIAALARDTHRVRLGQLVTANSYRNPALQAKIASTIDVISNGRLTFGIGSGWYEPDYLGYGYDFGTAGDRLRRLDEAVQVIRAFWTEDEVTFNGRYYRTAGGVNQPKGIQQPHIPLLIAGGGEKVTLKIAARVRRRLQHHRFPGDARTQIRHPSQALRKRRPRLHHDPPNSDDGVHPRLTDEDARSQVPPGSEFAFPGDLASYGLIGTTETIHDRIAAYEASRSPRTDHRLPPRPPPPPVRHQLPPLTPEGGRPPHQYPPARRPATLNRPRSHPTQPH